MVGRRRVIVGGTAAIAVASVSARSRFGQAAAQTAGLLAARGVYSAPGLSFSAIYLAVQMELWAKNGLKAELKQVQGGPLAMAALTNRDADFAGVASTDPVIGWDKGIKTLTVGAFTGALAMQFTARKDWLSKVGISPSSPIKDKIKAFKGARIGASTIGGGPAQYTRYLLRSAGLDPDQDVKILGVGFGTPRMAALRTNQVDLTVGDAPEADQLELEGTGQLYIDCALEVAVFREFPYTVMSVTPEFADQKPDIVRRVVHAIGEGNDQFTSNFGLVVDTMRKVYPSVDPRALDTALERDKASYPRGARMTETMWKNNLEVSLSLGMIAKPIPVDEGVFWTNNFAA